MRKQFDTFLEACGVKPKNPYPYIDTVNNTVISENQSYPIPEGVKPPHHFPIAGFRAEDRMELLHDKARKQQERFIETLNAIGYWDEVFNQD